jgi:PKD repeat protein
MRLSWFTGSRLLRRRGARWRRRSKATTLRVRQLERRRVLDGAVTTVVVGAVTSSESPPPPGAAATDAATEPPLMFNWAPPPEGSQAAAGSPDMAQGAAANSGPFLLSQPDQNVNEGAMLDLSALGGASALGLYVDTDIGDTHTATVNWGDGSPTENATVYEGVGSGAIGGTHVYEDEGTYTVTVVVMDNNGGMDTDEFDVIVAPVAPTATLSNNGPVFEGSSATVSFSNEFDPSSADTMAGFHYSYDLNDDGMFDVGDGTYGGSGANTSQVVSSSTLFEGPGDYTVKARIIDKDGEFTDYTTIIHVSNAAPTLTNVVGDTIFENEVATIGATIVDSGATDVFEVDVDWLDGSTATIGGLGSSDVAGMMGDTTYQWTAATRRLELSHQYFDDGLTNAPTDTYDVSLIVRDDEMDSTGPYLAPVIVNNVAPALIVATMQNVFEGDELDLSALGGAPALGLYIDPGTLDTHTATVDWGDGTAIENATVFAGMGSGTLGGTHVYADDGKYKVTVTITDKDGESDTESFFVNVANRNPVVLAPHGDQMILEGQTVSFSDLATFTDAGFDNPLNTSPFMPPAVGDPLAESFTYDIDWGDGRDAITGMTIADMNGAPGVPSSGTIAASHTYADDGVYQVTVTVHDDNGGIGTSSFFVTVSNVAPSLTDTMPANTVAEGQAFVLSNLGGPLPNMGVGLSDPGFDNPLNTSPFMLPAIGNQFAETFTGYTIDWGDGTADTPVTIVMRTSGSPGVPTTALFQHAAHTYADNGVYTVRVRVADDNMSGNFTTGTNGVDYIDLTFEITVTNVSPTLAPPAPSAAGINENGSVNFTVLFSDPGFDNPFNDNTPPNGGEVAETFTYDINWGDGRHTVADVTVGATPGGVGIPSEGSFGGNHIYADDGIYTVIVTISDDDGGVDVRTFQVTVNNTNPVVVTPLAGDDVNTDGITRIRFAFSDWGFDNPANPTPPPTGSQFLESFTYIVNWGDGTIDTITVTNGGQVVNAQTMVLSSARTSGNEGIMTTGSFEVQHLYLGPPNPLNPTADIHITVTLLDDNGGSVSGAIDIGNPGIQVVNVAIDTTPDVPRLEFIPQQMAPVILNGQTTTLQSLQTTDTRIARSELAITSDRYLELVVVSPEGIETLRYPLRDEALADLRGLIITLPENHYRIYLIRTENNSRRLVLEVYVRRGRIVDPADVSEGTRDKPPTEGDQQLPVRSLENNRFIDESNQNEPEAMINPAVPAERVSHDDIQPATLVPHASRWRWAVPAAALGLVARRGSWSREVDAAFDRADDRAWTRLRRAGRRRLVK